MATLWNRAGDYIFALWFLSFFLSSSSSFFSRLISAVADWMSIILPHMVCLSANLECRSETCSTWLAGNAGRKKIVKKSPSVQRHHRATLLSYIYATKARIDNRKKNLLNSNITSTYPHNMVKFGPPATQICWRVWGTPANFNGFRVLAALLHGTLVVGINQTLLH